MCAGVPADVILLLPMTTIPHGGGQTATSGDAPVAHSIVEERLFLLTVRCACGGGPLQKVSQTLARSGPRTIDLVRARCPRCARERDFRFDVTSFFGRFYPRRGVSDTREPSQLLDAVAWVRWARLYYRAFEGERTGLAGEDRADCGILALRCLDEALKLFPAGEGELRDADLHTHGSREAFAAAAPKYNRYELMGLQLEISMVLASAGIDPDGSDPGIPHHGLVRLVEAVKRSGAGGPGPAGSGDGRAPALPAPSGAPSALLLGGASEPLRLPAPAEMPLLPGPRPSAVTPHGGWVRSFIRAALAGVIAAITYAVARALGG